MSRRFFALEHISFNKGEAVKALILAQGSIKYYIVHFN